MCQHAEGESNYLQGVEDRAQIEGFAAAKNRVARDSNPYENISIDRTRFEAWQSGWSCWHSKVLPWSLEKVERSNFGIMGAAQTRNQFRDDRTLPDRLELMLDRTYRSQQESSHPYKVFSF